MGASDPQASESDRVAVDVFARAAAGDRAALDSLLVRYFPQLHAFVHARLGQEMRARTCSVDIVQSVCGQLLDNQGAASFADEDRFRAWLFTTALNKLRQRHRYHRAARRDIDRSDPLEDVPATELAHYLTPSQVAAGHETAAALSSALNALSEEHREVITLARVGALPHKVIAEVMGRSEEAVRQLLVRALVRLAGELRQRGVEVDGSLDARS